MPALLLLAAAAAASAPTPAIPELHLICHGSGQNQVWEVGGGGLFSNLFLGGHTVVQNFDDEMRVDIVGAAGKITIPGRFVAPMHRKTTTFDAMNLQISDDAISGKIAVTWAAHPNFRINRQTGVIEMDGTIGSFTGKCQKTEPGDRAF